MNKLIVVMILAGLLVFGCTGQQPAAPANGAANNTVSGNGAGASANGSAVGGAGAGSGVAAGGSASAGANASAGTPAGGSGGSSGNSGASGGAGIAAITTYAAAMAAGLPLECSVTTNGQGSTIDIKGQDMYMKGQAGGQTYEMVYKNGVTYMKLSTELKSVFAQMGKNCDWLTVTANASSTSGAPSSPVSADSVKASDVAWSCIPGLFNDDKFLTPGSSCPMSDLYPSGGAPAPGTPPGDY